MAQTLHATLNVSDRTGDVDWAEEIRKYPVNWLGGDNMTLTLLERLEGRVATLRERLHRAEEERDQVQTAIHAGEPSRQQRREARAANNDMQDDVADLEGLFE